MIKMNNFKVKGLKWQVESMGTHESKLKVEGSR